MQHKFKLSIQTSIIAIVMFASCKKGNDVVAPSVPSPTPTPTLTVALDPEKIKDSTLLYSKDIYLWNNQIPSTFDARSYADPVAIMTAIRQYSIEPGFSGAVDKWSFAMKKTEWDALSGGLGTTFSATNATSGDFGLTVFFFGEGDLRVKFVEKSSPSGLAGVRRGWMVLKINGNTDITTSNSSFIIENVYKATHTTFTFIKPDGSQIDITLDAAHYKERPVYLDTVYAVNSKKVGYLVFSSFLGDTAQIYNDFQSVFSRFASQNVSDVIVDLRYNGGGYVSVQEKLANYLVSASANGGVMMKQIYNDKYVSYNNTTVFKKSGSLNLPRIFFIVSKSTASASELLINNLKPYMDVKLLGNSNTHGKPVGFFPIPVGEWYIFPVSFKTINKNGEGNYYGGLTVNTLVNDGLNKDWGDITETSLASALKYINSGSFRIDNTDLYTEQPQQLRSANINLDAPSFKGMVDPRRMK